MKRLNCGEAELQDQSTAITCSSPRAGTRVHPVMPHSLASSAYSTSISSRVSICSDTNEIGTVTMSRTPEAPSSRIESSVYGRSHSTGPTRLWYASV